MNLQVSIPEGQSGNWRVERFEVSESDATFSAIRDGWRAVRPGTYTRLMRGGVLVMSDTPAEISDHLGMIRRASGSVLINGLGLGMCAAAVLAKDVVTDVTVIEKSPDVIALVEPSLASDKLTVVNADALEFKPTKGKRYNVVWHDIWDYICADNLSDMHKLHRRYGRRADWQGSWCRASCERAHREAVREERRWNRWR